MHGPVAIILAAGQGKRMKSEKAKVLHEVCGQPMIRYVVDAARGPGPGRSSSSSATRADQVRDYLGDEPDILFATQTEQLGTGHAVKVCRPLLGGLRGTGAGPGRRRAAAPARAAGRPARPPAGTTSAACLLGTAVVPDPTGFGRILRDSAGRFLRIVEERDCNARGDGDQRGQPELLRLRAARPLGRPRPDRHQQRPGRVLPDRRPRTSSGDGPQGRRAQRARARRHPRRQHPPAPRPGARRSCRRGSRTTG